MISRPKTYADYVPPAEGKSYQISSNTDGTSRISDVTQYLTEGSDWGATDANAVWNALETVDENIGETTAKFGSNGALTVPNGGTGATTHTANSVLVGNGTSAVKNVASKSGALYATAANGAPTFGTLPILQGGTGLTTSPSMLTNLGSTTAANVLSASPRPGVTGTLPVANGGTGGSTAKAAEYNILGGMSASTNAVSDTNQIVFKLTSPSASSGVTVYKQASLLLDYIKEGIPVETGTWTPTLSGSTTAGTPTYVRRAGIYLKIGNVCYVSGRVGISALGGMAGDIRIGGLPFVHANNLSIAYGSCGVVQTSHGMYNTTIETNAAYMHLKKASSASFTVADLGTSTTFDVWNLGLFYFTA